MSTAEGVRLHTSGGRDVEDAHLEQLFENARARERLFGPMGVGEPEQDLDPDRPYDLEIPKPRLLDLRKLWQLTDKPYPPEVQAAVGNKVPHLVYHGLTPFHRPGEPPTGIWGMGYEAHLDIKDAETIDFVPNEKLITVATLNQDLQLGLSANGEIGIPQQPLQLLNALPGVKLAGGNLSATTDLRFALSIGFTFTLLAVQAGPLNGGGVRWNFYRRADRIDLFQPLMQTLLLPRGLNQLTFKIKTWVRRRGRFFGLVRSREWIPPEATFEVSV